MDFDYKNVLKNIGLNEQGKVQMFIDDFVLYHSQPYIPAKHIHESGVIATKLGSGQIIWDSPDAQYHYEGKLMVDPITLKGAFYNPNAKDGELAFWSRPNTEKIMDPQNRDLVYRGDGLMGSKWFDRMIEREYDDLLKGVNNIIGGKK